ncbi:site-specific integrase [Nocardia otitidiscaviarum]|uniref:tyrosine-type recombinase/integrase n=1 Tax=Nocardia otitidiscaviarum TaxID=1823 RepID=UPI001892D535|nr:tyrosine-type recombinase/integrase [Nocardia otitidiscaviarum]MBF6238253.1 site-specific integrase [Nocardia otitidiscaviarum]
MAARRNRRAGVEDRWYKTVTTTAEDGTKTSGRVESANYGCAKRWRGRYVDDNGQEHAKSFARKVDAQDWLNQATSALLTGTHVAPSAGRETIGAIGRRWLTAQAHLKDTTSATRRHTWRAHVEPRWGSTEVRDVRTTAVRAWIADMVTAGTGVPTLENALGVLRMICDTAVEDRQILRNPCTGVKLPRRTHRARGYLTHVQVEQLAREVAESSTVVRFLAYTGLRWGEMAALKVSNFDMLRRRVNLVEAVAEVDGRLVWSTLKNYERRSVPFPKFLTDELAALMRGKGRDALVFTSPEGETLRVSTYRPRVFKPAVARLRDPKRHTSNRVDSAVQPGNRLDRIASTTVQRGETGTAALDSTEKQGGQSVHARQFPYVTPHDLRHTAASLAISAGANVKAVQTMLGHKSAAMTLDTYADLFPDDLESVADALDTAHRSALAAAADELRTGTDDRDS